MLQKLLPRDDKFYSLLEQSSQNLVKAAEALKELSFCNERSAREEIVHRIEEIEHDGDSITHDIFSNLNSTFVTPLDREDIHSLASALDDVLDHMNGAAKRFSLYKLESCPPPMIQLIDVLSLSIKELHQGVHLIRNVHNYDALEAVFKKVNDYENEADDIFESAIADLFEHEKDPIQVIKIKEVFVGLETATDKCEDAANILEGILIKHV